MRTTLQIEDDVLEKARELAAEKGVPFKTVVNEALRSGLELAEKPAEKKAYRTEARDMGLRRGLSLDNVQDLLMQVEGEEFR
jgi:hypothetical protein